MKRVHLLRRIGRVLELSAVATGAAIGGAVVEHFLDPDRGHARRARLRDEIRGSVRAAMRRSLQLSSKTIRHTIDHRRGEIRSQLRRRLQRNEPPDNVTLAQKVRSEVLGHLDEDLRHISVDVVEGMVTLRGEINTATDGMRIVLAVRQVRGVQSVENLLHQRGDDAPNKAAALRLRPEVS